MTPRRAPRRKTVLVAAPVPPPVHGAAAMAVRLIEMLQSKGYTVMIVDRRFSQSVDEIGRFRWKKVAAATSFWYRAIRVAGRRPELAIVFGSTRAMSFVVDYVIFGILRWRRVPAVNYVHARGYADLAARGHVWRWAVRDLLSHLTKSVALSPSLAVDLPGATSIAFVGNTVPEVGAPRTNERHVVLFLSNLLPEKGAREFLAVSRSLARDHVDLEFVGAGADVSGELAWLQGATRDEPRIKFIGAVTAAERDAMLRTARVLIFPSLYRREAQPLVILEALEAGTPVVAYDIGGIRDIVGDDCGRVVRSGDAAALEAAARDVLADPDAWARLSAGARARYESHHSAESFATAWDAILTELTSPDDRRHWGGKDGESRPDGRR